MDFSTYRFWEIRQGRTLKLEDFIKDFKLIWKNCIVFNRKYSALVRRMANILEKAFDEMVMALGRRT